MSKAVPALAAIFLLPGCLASYQRCYQSRLISVSAARGAPADQRKELRRSGPWFEDTIVRMAGDFQVPLHQVIPVRVYHRGNPSSQKCYYNRVTGAIVLDGPVDPAAFVHELSHLLAHRISRSPPYWSDQALAEYMETRWTRPGMALLSAPEEPPQLAVLEELHLEKARHLARRIAEAQDSSEVLDHLTARAAAEERSWGLMVVRYLFEERWGERIELEGSEAGPQDQAQPRESDRRAPMGNRIRRLLSTTTGELALIAPEVLQYCRRPERLAGYPALSSDQGGR